MTIASIAFRRDSNASVPASESPTTVTPEPMSAARAIKRYDRLGSPLARTVNSRVWP